MGVDIGKVAFQKVDLGRTSPLLRVWVCATKALADVVYTSGFG